jgi:hypothetical protein
VRQSHSAVIVTRKALRCGKRPRGWLALHGPTLRRRHRIETVSPARWRHPAPANGRRRSLAAAQEGGDGAVVVHVEE